jgi:FHS family glucose/mannose:H+ symporter-like MFS transporter
LHLSEAMHTGALARIDTRPLDIWPSGTQPLGAGVEWQQMPYAMISKMKVWPTRAESLPRIYPSGWLLCLGFTVTGVAVTVLGPVLPAIIQRWKLQDFQAGLLLSVQFLGCFAGSVLVTRHLRRALLLGSATLAAGWFAFALALAKQGGGWLAPGALLIAGFGAGHMMSAANLIAGQTHRKRRGSGLSLFNAFWSFGAILSSLAIGNLVLRFSIVRILLGFGGFVVCIFGGFLLQILRRRRGGDAEGKEGSQEPLSAGHERDGIPRNQWLLFAAMFFLYGGVEASINAWMTTYTMRHSDSALWLGEASVAAFWISITVGRVLAAGALRIVEERVMQPACLTGAVLSLGMVLVARSGIQIIGAALLTGLFLAPVFPSMCSLLIARGPRPRQVGWALAITGLGATVLPSLTGFISTRTSSLRAGLALSMVSAFVLLTLSLLMPRSVPH